jgi:hypothetical protein
MAKRHKNNTRFRKKKRENVKNDFYARELRLNKLISDFIYDYKHASYPPDIIEYRMMDKKRLEIKRLLAMQQGELWKQSYRRKRFYLKQLNRFKYHYVGWKKYTYYTYLHERFGMPLRFVQPLVYFIKTKWNFSSVVFTF